MNERPIDFYIKGLPFDDRQEIFKRMEACLAGKMRKLMEKPIGYPIFHSLGCGEEEIARQEAKSTARFRAVNEYIHACGRPGLFSDPEDTYRSAKEYVDLLTKMPKEALQERFGCTWEDYVPEVWQGDE
ncbi:MAG: hypothetical protein IJB75_02490 [Oscillospiraceae bacterium]|nr:hypothetical protein [Oscillospiraceae bacterium]